MALGRVRMKEEEEQWKSFADGVCTPVRSGGGGKLDRDLSSR